MLKRISIFLMAGFYIFAGINHFRSPEFYYGMIPPYFLYPEFINIASGVIEIILGTMLIFSATRRIAVLGIILMLLAFIPAHIHHIQTGGCPSELLCVPVWVAWVRLLVIQPLLIVWAWWNGKY